MGALERLFEETYELLPAQPGEHGWNRSWMGRFFETEAGLYQFWGYYEPWGPEDLPELMVEFKEDSNFKNSKIMAAGIRSIVGEKVRLVFIDGDKNNSKTELAYAVRNGGEIVPLTSTIKQKEA